MPSSTNDNVFRSETCSRRTDDEESRDVVGEECVEDRDDVMHVIDVVRLGAWRLRGLEARRKALKHRDVVASTLHLAPSRVL